NVFVFISSLSFIVSIRKLSIPVKVKSVRQRSQQLTVGITYSNIHNNLILLHPITYRSFPEFFHRSITASPKRSPEPLRSPSCESCEYTNAAVVEEQLRQMQKQLNEISIIPMQIQATLSYLTKVLAKFAPPELQQELPSSLRSSSVRETIQEEVEEHLDHDEDEDLTSCLELLFDESQVLDVVPPREYEYEYYSDDEPEYDSKDEETVTEEERLKQEKLDRVTKMELSWPWSQSAKPIHKRSNCHLVPSVALEKSKIKQLTEGDLHSFNRGYRQRIGN
ncbi:uncharacterized protein LOC131425704, partial [Malaya genurostris]|uniref:uncharacterized protein LOC131425704 n=1 Tax=Malaya genurostris TaxID=325434 RepID=UPI0026F3F8B6